VPTVEDFLYIEARPAVVYRLVSNLARLPSYLPPHVHYLRALTVQTDEPGARAELEVQLAPLIWRSVVVQVHAVEPPRCVIMGPPDAGNFLTRWTLEPEPPGTLVTLRTDFTASSRWLENWLNRFLRRTYRELLLRLRAAAQGEAPQR
jgi:ribosome-associated toxin RatA of RatAB toxin-antitoxin module